VSYSADQFPCKFRGPANGSLNCGCGIGTQPTFPCSNPLVSQQQCVIQLGNKKWKYREQYESCSMCDWWEKPEGWTPPPKKKPKPPPPISTIDHKLARPGDGLRRGGPINLKEIKKPERSGGKKGFPRPGDRLRKVQPVVDPECSNPDRPALPYERDVVRHLLFHVGPFSGNGIWQRNVEQVLKRIHLFNGRRIVGIVTGEGLDPPEAVMEAFKGEAEFIVERNNPKLREVVTFVPMFSQVESVAPNEVVFYGQAKGVTRPADDSTTVHRWTDIMYETLLDHMDIVEPLLERFPVAGSFKKVGRGFQGSASSWHYSGSFCWFRSAELFKRDWQAIDHRWWGIESYPSLHFTVEEAACVFRQGLVPELDLYDYRYFHEQIVPHYEQWRSRV
jgi:hypothetical protein